MWKRLLFGYAEAVLKVNKNIIRVQRRVSDPDSWGWVDGVDVECSAGVQTEPVRSEPR